MCPIKRLFINKSNAVGTLREIIFTENIMFHLKLAVSSAELPFPGI